jgi:hypothetical protein
MHRNNWKIACRTFFLFILPQTTLQAPHLCMLLSGHNSKVNSGKYLFKKVWNKLKCLEDLCNPACKYNCIYSERFRIRNYELRAH